MAVLDFPASPAIGDKYPTPAVAGQPQYTWDGEKWTTVGAQVTTAAPASALPLMDAATAVVGTATKYAREDHVHPKIAAAPFDAMAYSGMQVNGSFDVNQERGVGVSIPGAGYVSDGNWWVTVAGPSVIAAKVNTHKTYFGGGLPQFLSIAVTTAEPSIAAGSRAAVQQNIEGYRIARLAWGTVNAQPMTIAFWTAHVRTGTYTGTVINAAGDRCYAFSYTQNVSNAAEYKTVTIPGCTNGVWADNNSVGLGISFAMASGSSGMAPSLNNWISGTGYFAGPGQINGIAATTDAFYLTGVVVLPGSEAPSAARSPLIMRPYDQELVTCQRYYQQLGGSVANDFGILSLYANAGGVQVSSAFTLPVEMRSAPTTGFGPGSWAISNVTATNVFAGTRTAVLQAISTAAGMCFFYSDGPTKYLVLNARL